MIDVRDMDEADFQDFKAYFIPDYAVEIEENYHTSAEEAYRLAEQEILEDLPEGRRTKDHVLLSICLSNPGDRGCIGFLWYKVDVPRSHAFIYDFYIKPPFRSKGYGRESMSLLEARLYDQGIQELKLRVAAKNERALALYKELDFYVTGINMSKKCQPQKEYGRS